MTRDSITASADPPIDPLTDPDEDELHRLILVSQIFLDEEFMGGRLRFRVEDYRQPRLRRCRFDPETLVFLARLGGGNDGFVWKVRFGNLGPFAMKVFWDQEPPQEVGSYYPLQRECQNAAVFQMMSTAVSGGPVLVYGRPFGEHDAGQNYFSFCEENAISRLGLSADPNDLPEGAEFVTEIPRVAQCYGWVSLHSDKLEALPIVLQPTHYNPDKARELVESHRTCIAIVYELIEEGSNTMRGVMQMENFLWNAGFAYANDARAKSWKNNVLVDYCDIVHACGYGWTTDDYMERSAEEIISDSDLVESTLNEMDEM